MVFKVLSTAVAAGAIAVGSYAYNQYHQVYVELNKAQAQVEAERAKNEGLSSAAAGVVTACSNLTQALARYSDRPTAADAASSVLASNLPTEPLSPEPSLVQARASAQ